MAAEPKKLRKIGPFQLKREIGVGGMGIVYEGVYEKNNRIVAVKVLSPDMSANESVNQRFIRETDILKKLKHPNIIRYFGAGSNRTQRFYAMELIDGGALDQVLRKRGKLPWRETIALGLQIAKALEHAHAAGIVHRDLKPGNLLVTTDGVLKLSDFGIARDTQATALTQAGKTVGTMNYMAPEQISGKQPITRRTDLYALGCVLFQMLTGETPFQSDNQAELLFKHLEDVPPSVLDYDQTIPIWLSKLVEELLEKHPDDRPFDALAVQVKLEEVIKKVEKQEAKLRNSTAAGESELTVAFDKKTVSVNKRKRRKKKGQKQVPFWEKTWFLVAILVGFVSVAGWWFMNSNSEESLFKTAEEFMASTDAIERTNAERPLQKLLANYPDGTHAEQAKTWLDQIGMSRVERRIQTNIRMGIDPKSEAERLYIEASQFEKFGDRLTALDKYQAMPKVLENNDDNRPFLNLARREAGKIKGTVGSETDRATFIEKKLEEADKLYLDGKKLAARDKWDAIIRLYGNIPEFSVFTDRAQKRIDEISG